MVVVPFLAAVLVLLTIAQFGGMFFLSARLGRKQFNYRISGWFVFRNWVLLGMTGWWSDKRSDDDDSPLGRRLRLKVDSERSNAPEIAAERQLLARLMALPRDTAGEVSRRVGASIVRLAALRAYDNNVAALIGLGLLADDVDRAKLTVESVGELLAGLT